MTFPTSSVLVDFALQPDGGPPPTASFGGALFAGEMIVSSGLCLDDGEDPGNCDTPYTAQTFTLPAEAWAILGPDNEYPSACVYICDGTADNAYIFSWQELAGDVSYFLFDQDFASVWSSTNEYPTLVEGSGLGLRANLDGSLELWISPDGVTWTNIHIEIGLIIPDPATIGLGNLAVG